MKRSRITRKPHPDNPYSTFAKRKAGIKPVGKTKKKEQAATGTPRAALVRAAGGVCQCCNQPSEAGEPTEAHEIPAGSSRHRAIHDPNCMLVVKRSCHDRLQGESKARQAELKLRSVIRSLNKAFGREALLIKSLEIVDASEVDCEFCDSCRKAFAPWELAGGMCDFCNEARAQNLDGDFN